MKKLVAFLLSAAMCLSIAAAPAGAVSGGGREAVSVAVMEMMGAIQGDGSGSLGLSGALTRAQLCKIAVTVMGLSKSVGQYAGYTIFPDVPSTSWAAGYVNLAVRSAGIMSGYANGRFGPDDAVTFAQAVTVLMRMLGYTDSDVGAKWPDGYMEKAGEIGLTEGVSLPAQSAVTKGQAAVLFANLLSAETKSGGKKFLETISGATAVDGVFLVSADAKTDAGEPGAVKIAGAKTAAYLPANKVPDELVGRYGALVLDSSGKALVFVPDESGRTVVSTVSEASASSIKCADGTKITISTSSPPDFNFDGEPASYSEKWPDIAGGMLVSAHYTAGGALKCVLVAQAGSDDGSVEVVTGDSYSIPAAAEVYINGCRATAEDIIKYDVVSYSGGYGVCNVSRRYLTGRIESVDPSFESLKTVTVLGKQLEVLESAVPSLAGFGIGSSVTLMLTSDDKVAWAVPASALNHTNYGVVESLSSSAVTVRLTNGITVSGKTGTVASGVEKGDLAAVYSTQTGYLSLGALSNSTSVSSIDIAAGKMGSKKLSKAVKVYECVGDSTVKEISLSDILVDTIEALKVKFAACDHAGDVCVLLLDDVTGDVYTYGFVTNGTVTQTSGGLSATNPTVRVTNSEGTTDAVLGSTGLSDGSAVGIAATGGGTLAGYAALTAVSGVGRGDFKEAADGTVYVSTAAGVMPVAADVQVYMSSTGNWTTLSKARAASDSMTVYYDKTPSTGGKARVIVAY